EDPADAGGGPVPSISKTGSNTATLSTNGVGSFQVLAFIDSNTNGKRDDDEGGAVLPLILVKATLNANLSAGHSANVSYVTNGTLSAVRTGDFNVSSSGATAGMYLGGKVDLVGGGADGRRGLDRVFGGWIQNITAQNVVGSYANNHKTVYIFVSNPPASRFFLPPPPPPAPPPPPPAIIPVPLLDTGRPNLATGGGTDTLTSSQFTSRTSLAAGQTILVDAVDSPRLNPPLYYPPLPGNALQNFSFGLDFTAYLSVWTNSSGSSGGTGDPADTTYGVVLDQPWTVRATYNVNAAGAGTAVGTPSVTAGAATTHSPATPATMKVVAPTPGQSFSIDARN